MKQRPSLPPFQWSLNPIFRSAAIAMLFAVFIFLGTNVCHPQSRPDLVLHRTVTYADRQTYIELPFDVPEGITRVTIESSYTERDKHTTIDLGLFDSERFRGWSGGNKASFTLSETDATPSYLPGPIRSGTWKLILGVPNIREGMRSEYVANIYLAHATDSSLISTFSEMPLRIAPAWYRGDLHMHDAHSDGSCLSQSGRKVPCPLYKTVESAEKRGLDFIAISDTTRSPNTMQCANCNPILITCCSYQLARSQPSRGTLTYTEQHNSSIFD